MKWTPAPIGNYAISNCGRYLVNWTGDKSQYMAVRLGKERRTARGEQLWEGSEILKVGDKAECVQACEVDSESNRQQ